MHKDCVSGKIEGEALACFSCHSLIMQHNRVLQWVAKDWIQWTWLLMPVGGTSLNNLTSLEYLSLNFLVTPKTQNHLFT